MSIDYVKIENFELARNFIRKAACEDTDHAILKNEDDQDKIKNLLAANGITVEVGKKVKFVFDDAETMNIRIPFGQALRQFPDGAGADPMIGKNPGPGPEKIPNTMHEYFQLYAAFLGNYRQALDPAIENDVRPDVTLNFNLTRLADYALSNCK